MSDLVGGVRAATAILTRLPVAGRVGEAPPVGVGAAAFPLIGGAIGAVAAVPVLVIGAAEPVLAAIAALAVIAVVTGGLHLDGLADTVDALMAPDEVRADAARRDPRVGPGGVVALILVLGAEVAAMASLVGDGPALAATALVAVLAASRLVPVLLAAVERRRGGDEVGFGAWFARQVGGVDVALAVVGSIAIAGAVGWLAGSLVPPVAAAASVVLGLAAALAVRHVRGRLDGDGFGASTELAVVLGLAVAAVVGG